MTGSVYIITNTESQKCYIGSTVNVKKRWGHHKSTLRSNTHGNYHLQHAWNKYGESAFEFGVLEYLENQEELYLAEQFWIDIYKEESRELYNIALVTDCPMRGRKHSEETKLKMSSSQKGCTHTEETKCKIKEAKLGGKHTEESIQKMRDANSGERHPMFGRSLTEEHRHKISVSKCGHEVSEKVRCRWSQPYPAFINKETGEVIQPGINLTALCREQGLDVKRMCDVKNGHQYSHRGWAVEIKF